MNHQKSNNNSSQDSEENRHNHIIKNKPSNDLPWVSKGFPLDKSHDVPSKAPKEIPSKQPKEIPSTPQEITQYHSAEDQF